MRGDRSFLWPCFLFRRVVRWRRPGCGRVGERSGDGGSVADLPGFSAAGGAGDPPDDDDQRGQAAERGQDLVPPQPRLTRRLPVMSGRRVRVLTRRLLRIPELGFLSLSGQRLGLLAPLCAVPPAQDLGAGRVKIPSWVEIPSGPWSGIVLIGWWRLITHGFLPPARLRCRALPFKGTHQRQLRCTMGMKLTYHCYRAVFAWLPIPGGSSRGQYLASGRRG